jgi:hypothetical protein
MQPGVEVVAAKGALLELAGQVPVTQVLVTPHQAALTVATEVGATTMARQALGGQGLWSSATDPLPHTCDQWSVLHVT